MTNRTAVPPQTGHTIRVLMWYGTGILLATTVTIGIMSIILTWPPIPFNFAGILTLLVGIPATSETLRARRKRTPRQHDDAIIGQLEDRLCGH